MRKIICLVTSLLCFSAIAIAQPKAPPKDPKKPDFTKMGAAIPPFVIEKTKGGTFNNTNLKAGKPVMMMIFSPECGHCEYVVDSIKRNADKFKNTQFVIVAEERNKQHMKKFIDKTGIGSHPLFQQIGTNRGELIFSIYTYKVLPQINFYNSKHKLVKTFDGGNYPFDSVKMFIQ